MCCSETRHSCEQGDNLSGYYWTQHDGRSSGTQIIKDAENNLLLKVQLLKTPGGQEGWLLSIKSEMKLI